MYSISTHEKTSFLPFQPFYSQQKSPEKKRKKNKTVDLGDAGGGRLSSVWVFFVLFVCVCVLGASCRAPKGRRAVCVSAAERVKSLFAHKHGGAWHAAVRGPTIVL